MSILNLIPENEKELIEEYIRRFGPSHSNADANWYNWIDVDNVLTEWDHQKSKTLITLMDGQLILRRPYTYTAQTEGLSREIAHHLSDAPFTTFQSWWFNMTHTAGNYIELENPDGTPKDTKWYSKWSYPARCFDAYTLACNAYQDDDVVIKFPSGKKMKMFKGMKPMKIFHRFVEEFNGPEDVYDAFRTWHSMQLNQKKMDGELCLSIHPLDYMTMSDNANNWESCMRWTDSYGNVGTHGDYRTGTLECLNSPYIIEAYLHNPKHLFKLKDNWVWNSKQWRELFIVQEGIISEIKGYCFQDEHLTNTALMWIKELAAKNLGWEYESEEVNVTKMISMPDHGNDELYLSFSPTQYMYNDMGTLEIHRGRINKQALFGCKYDRTEQKMPNKEQWSYFIDIPYGGRATCMCCGKPFDYEDVSNIVLCDRCDIVKRCACCGEPIDDYSGYYIEDIDDYYCEGCYCDNCGTDSFSEESHLNDNMTTVYLLLGYDEDKEPVFYNYTAACYEPNDNWSFEETFNTPLKKIDVKGYWGWHTREYVTLDMVNDNYLRRFYNAFDIWPHPKNKYELLTTINQDIYYDTEMNPLYEEDN